ncbi:MAG: FtsQ-type POTRA domain-containing protein [Oscillospiraceae bacterium]|nr:FtsQ-type POTRA domain-containing protein [Oscillospiraceae bacterium]
MAQRKEQNKGNRPQQRKRRKRRRGRFGFLYQFLCLILVCAAIVAGCIVFFKANHIEVVGAERYTAEEIQQASGVSVGDNLFLINKFSVIHRLSQRLPYLDEVVIRRKLPDTLVVTVEECVPVAAIAWEDGYWIIDKRGKLLEEKDKPEGCPELLGLSILSPVQGSIITLAADDPRSESYKALFSALVEHGFVPHLKKINLSDETVIELQYEDRFVIRLDVGCDYEHKLTFLAKVLESLQSNETGAIDFTGENPRYIPEAG